MALRLNQHFVVSQGNAVSKRRKSLVSQINYASVSVRLQERKKRKIENRKGTELVANDS